MKHIQKGFNRKILNHFLHLTSTPWFCHSDVLIRYSLMAVLWHLNLIPWALSIKIVRFWPISSGPYLWASAQRWRGAGDGCFLRKVLRRPGRPLPLTAGHTNPIDVPPSPKSLRSEPEKPSAFRGICEVWGGMDFSVTEHLNLLVLVLLQQLGMMAKVSAGAIFSGSSAGR